MADFGAPNLFNVKGRSALITGASSGIGLMMAEGLIANGIGLLFLVGLERKERELLDVETKLQKLSQKAGHDSRIYVYRADVSNHEEIKSFSQWIRTVTDSIDIVLSNAGIRRDPAISIPSYSKCTLTELQKSLLSHSRKHWSDTFEVNTTAHFFLVAEFLDLLANAAQKGEGRGCVVVTSSCASMHLCTNVDLTSYATSKAATDHLVGILAAKVGRFGIRVNGINPGCTSRMKYVDVVFDTAMNPIGTQGNMFANLFDKVPAGRAGTPEDIVGTVLYLCSKAGAYVNGRSLCVDGGRVLVANGQE